MGGFGLYILVILLIVVGWYFLSRQTPVSYTKDQLYTAMDEGKVTSISIKQNSAVPTGTATITFAGNNDNVAWPGGGQSLSNSGLTVRLYDKVGTPLHAGQNIVKNLFRVLAARIIIG